MITESSPDQQSDIPSSPARTTTTPEATTQAWVTRAAIIMCVGIFLGIATTGDDTSWANLSRFGCIPSGMIWDGMYWGLVTSAFVHIALWHLGFIHLDPNNAWAYYNRSCANHSLGQDDNALADMRKAREIDPSIDQSNSPVGH